MAEYTVENTSRIGKLCRVFDADGNEIKDCVYVNTDTGRIVQIKRDSSGRAMAAPCGTEVAVVESFRQPPLRVEEKVMVESGDK